MTDGLRKSPPKQSWISDDEDWGANAARATLRSIRYDAQLIKLFREKAVAKLHNVSGEQLEPEEAALVPVLQDNFFGAKWGATLDKCSNEKIVRLALETLLVAVHKASPGRTGVREIDDDRGFQSLELFEKFVLSKSGDAE